MRVDQSPFYANQFSFTKSSELATPAVSFSAALDLNNYTSLSTADDTEGTQESDWLPDNPPGLVEADLGDSTDSLLAEIAKWADMSPAEKIRAQWLGAHGLTEESFAQLPADEQAAINKQIAEEVKRQLGGDTNQSEVALF